ncbi:MAG: Nif3-like dinuclear metal center hexameric protein [Planctomycetota bacterium]
MQLRLSQITGILSDIAPLGLAEGWDNVGLLLGDRQMEIAKVMTCLTITRSVVEEAEQEDVDLIVSHHPLPFKPLGRITTDTIPGEMVWRLCRSGVAVYSAHTAFDSAIGGINDLWAAHLGLQNPAPLIPSDSDPTVGAGRQGTLIPPVTAGDLMKTAAKRGGATRPRLVGDRDSAVTRLAVACGSGGSFLGAAARQGCQALLTGEATFHTCLEAQARGIALILIGHHASERFAMETLAGRLEDALDASIRVWASKREFDPISVDSDLS